MIYKQRTKPVALTVMESLKERRVLSFEEKRYYLSVKKGYEGEVKLDTYTVKLPCGCIVLNDLQLKHNQTDFQIDAVVIKGNVLHLIEVKNYSGTYDYRDDVLYAGPNFEIANPLFQIRKSQPLLQQLVRKLGYPFTVKAYVVFINPEFELFQLPRDLPFVFARQLPRFLQELGNDASAPTKAGQELAERLSRLHIEEYRPNNLPDYLYSDLKKGILCPECFSFAQTHTRKNRICTNCGQTESVQGAIHRSAEEFRILFPGQQLTVEKVHEWCGGCYEKQRMRRTLKRYYQMHYHRNGTYYTKI